MIEDILFSADAPRFDWPDAVTRKAIFGPKGAFLATLPRAWTPPFALFAASVFAHPRPNKKHGLLALSEQHLSRVRALAGSGGLIVRSSVIGESIWDRGTFESRVIAAVDKDFEPQLRAAVDAVLTSATSRRTGLVIQRYISAKSRGEFGNLLRVSKTRDHWELSTVDAAGAMSRTRFNTQRDEAAATDSGLQIRTGLSQQRLFGSVAAWLNNVLLSGRTQRLNCEWVTDHQQFYLVQIDEEDEDVWGVNPFQIRVSPAHTPAAAKGVFLKRAEGDALQTWDKLKVLNELWEPEATHKPTLFYVPVAALDQARAEVAEELESDFRSLIGPDNIIVRTSVRTGQKPPNLPRTDGLQPEAAARWCIENLRRFKKSGEDLRGLAFVAHRFIAARASAWVRAEPNNPLVEIHCLWGLPDALQYCPYDSWEVHADTEFATENPEYKSNILISGDDGGWKHVRVKNELARSLCIGRAEAIDLSKRTSAVVERIGRACHVMWFVGCVDHGGMRFNIPWYWTEAHEAEKNTDRSNYRVLVISDPKSLTAFNNHKGSRWRQAIELRPTDIDLMRDVGFIDAVGEAASKHGVPVILAGSTLAHAYYQLRRQGCTVVTRGEKEHSRIRQNTNFGKLVRDKIPARIAQRREAEVTRIIPNELLKGFLTGKLLEEAMEVRNAGRIEDKAVEMADLYEVFRALAAAEGVSLDEIVARADEKRQKVGGFEKGLVLLQTGILGKDRKAIQKSDRSLTQVLARKVAADTYEIPFSFFGFMELGQPRSLAFKESGIFLSVQLMSDRIQIRVSKEAEQLEFPLDLSLGPGDDMLSESMPPRRGRLSKDRR